jgi:RND family efflux transporter MFP subunit
MNPSAALPPTPSRRKAWATALLVLAVLAGVAATVWSVRAADNGPAVAPAPKRAALTVTVTEVQRAQWPLTVSANGSIAAWQEASVGAEVHGLRLAQVQAQVGDRVRRGQVLARFADETVQADLAQARAAVAEAEAMLAEAQANAQRARDLQASGALSAQQIQQMLTAERAAQARLDAQRAVAQAQQLRLAQTAVRAPDDGVISARSATVGAVTPAGTELFRLIRQGRLEWRAEVPAAQLALIRPGQRVQVTAAGGRTVEGRVRLLAPTVDAATRSGLVHVDLPRGDDAVKAGMFAAGEFDVGRRELLWLPQSAVQLREGLHQVFVVDEAGQVRQLRVEVGRRHGEGVEIRAGLAAGARVVASGGAFLADGDTVRVVAP